MVNIELTEEQCEMFKDFMKQYDKYCVMRDNGVFDTRTGRVTLHFNARGDIQKIEKDFVAFVLLTA